MDKIKVNYIATHAGPVKGGLFDPNVKHEDTIEGEFERIAKAQPSTHKECKVHYMNGGSSCINCGFIPRFSKRSIAMMIVNQILDLAGTSVGKRQAINDQCEDYVHSVVTSAVTADHERLIQRLEKEKADNKKRVVGLTPISPASWRRPRMPKKQRERRRRGDGGVSVAKRDANGKPILWKASISLGAVTIDNKARRNRPTEYADTEKEAYQKLQQLQSKHLTGDNMTPDKQTVEAFLLRWLAHVKLMLTPGTYGAYESRLRCHIIPAIGGIKLKALKTAHVQVLLDALVAKGLEPNTVKGIRRTIIRALNVARKWGDVKVNVAVDTESPEVIETKPLALNEAQLDRLLEMIAGDPLEDVILVSLATGARIGECLGLLWANIDYDAHELHITGAVKRYRLDEPDGSRPYTVTRDRYTKTKDERDQYLPDALAAVFHRRWQLQREACKAAGTAWKEQGLVFTDVHGGPLNPATVSHDFGKIARRTGLPPGFSFHNLRHSCATFLIKQGEQTRTVMEVLGHRNPKTTARYGIVLPEVSRDALDKHSQRLTRRGVQHEQ